MGIYIQLYYLGTDHARCSAAVARQDVVQDAIFTIGALGLGSSNKNIGVYLIKINARIESKIALGFITVVKRS